MTGNGQGETVEKKNPTWATVEYPTEGGELCKGWCWKWEDWVVSYSEPIIGALGEKKKRMGRILK